MYNREIHTNNGTNLAEDLLRLFSSTREDRTLDLYNRMGGGKVLSFQRATLTAGRISKLRCDEKRRSTVPSQWVTF